MKRIEVSSEVFGRIWALRVEGEETENDILRRILPPSPFHDLLNVGGRSGLHDQKNQVFFPDGFKIFRNHRGSMLEAVIEKGRWKMIGQDKEFFSLNELSRAAASSPENAWKAWWFVDADGAVKRVDALRPQQSIIKKGPRKSGGSSKKIWREDVRQAVASFGRPASLSEIYSEVKSVRMESGRSWPASAEAIVRRELEYNSSDSESFQGKHDLFSSTHGIGAGIWEIRK